MQNQQDDFLHKLQQAENLLKIKYWYSEKEKQIFAQQLCEMILYLQLILNEQTALPVSRGATEELLRKLQNRLKITPIESIAADVEPINLATAMQELSQLFLSSEK